MWTPFNYFIGSWRGSGKGQSGLSRVERTYEFVLNNKFLFVKSKSTYEPQEQNPKGEIHEEWGLISYDKAREKQVFRQFHVEGFVNQYVLDQISEDGQSIHFVTEGIENIPPGWRAREIYRILNPDEFIEVFELAGPGKEFEVYGENRFQRVQGVQEAI
ncbi:MAG TPA: hypothetical protein VFR47_15845 [Anaerolineales bacterium]|nr:hypothetical protein [Anaerolineales bacterium]